MFKFKIGLPLAAALAGFILLGETAPVQAEFKLRISDGTTTQVLSDTNGDGVISFNGSIGNFNVVVTTGLSKPAIGNANLASMDVTALTVTTGASGGVLTIDMTDTDFKVVPGANNYANFAVGFGGNISAGGNASFQSWVNYGAGGNQEFGGLESAGGSTRVSTISPQAGNGFGVSTSDYFTLSTPDAFSMTSRTVISLSGNGTFASTDGHTSVVTPAPASLTIAAIALPLLSGLGWRRRRLAQA